MILFVTAIGTDSGKTVVSSILTEALNADYWKPIQAGFPRDTEIVQTLVSNPVSRFHPEAYLLNSPESPHSSAKKDKVLIELDRIQLPVTENHLVIEGAGGMLVPLNDQDYVIDIAQKFDVEIILVANIYLGSINHTLLSIEELKKRNLRVKGIVFNGTSNPEAEDIILKKSTFPCLLKIQEEEKITKDIVVKYARLLEEIMIVLEGGSWKLK